MRRKASRKRVRVSVRFGVNGLDQRGYTTDLSPEGLAIKTNQVYPPGTEILIRLDTDDTILTARGTVRWAKQVPPLLIQHARCGMGVQFTALSQRFRQYLGKLGKER
jgi:Tfp pilus assembly protein PilZ